MRVVIDTNVFISSFISSGNPREIIDLWKESQIKLCLSKPIVEEYIRVLRRLGLDDDDEVDEILYLFARGYNLIFTAKTPILRIVEDDPDDNKFFECAVALKARYIISGDKKVLAVDEYMGIRVVTPQKFLQLMESN